MARIVLSALPWALRSGVIEASPLEIQIEKSDTGSTADTEMPGPSSAGEIPSSLAVIMISDEQNVLPPGGALVSIG